MSLKLFLGGVVIISRCFWHLLPWDPGALDVIASGFVKGLGTGIRLGHGCFYSPTLLSAGGPLVYPRPQIPYLLTYSDMKSGGSNNLS